MGGGREEGVSRAWCAVGLVRRSEGAVMMMMMLVVAWMKGLRQVKGGDAIPVHSMKHVLVFVPSSGGPRMSCTCAYQA